MKRCVKAEIQRDSGGSARLEDTDRADVTVAPSFEGPLTHGLPSCKRRRRQRQRRLGERRFTRRLCSTIAALGGSPTPYPPPDAGHPGGEKRAPRDHWTATSYTAFTGGLPSSGNGPVEVCGWLWAGIQRLNTSVYASPSPGNSATICNETCTRCSSGGRRGGLQRTTVAAPGRELCASAPRRRRFFSSSVSSLISMARKGPSGRRARVLLPTVPRASCCRKRGPSSARWQRGDGRGKGRPNRNWWWDIYLYFIGHGIHYLNIP